MNKYRSEIDGLRALAIIPVILFHFNISVFQGGFVGVDIFFVISGYLITSLILKALNNNDFSFLAFYERRARRLFPAAFIVTIFCCITGWYILAPNDFQSFGKSLWTFAIFGSNIHFMNEVGYFDAPSLTKPLLHTWSLSVEEQYYLLIPAILFIAHRKIPNAIPLLLCILIALSFVYSTYQVNNKPEYAFYMLPTRAWELLLGSLIASSWLPAPRNNILSNILAAAGLMMILSAFLLYNKNTPFPGLAALLPCLGTALIIWTNTVNKNLIGKTFSIRPLVTIGLISYPLYLWHWPLIIFTRYYLDREFKPDEILAVIALTVLLSWLTWKYIEQPVRKRQVLATQGPIITTAAIGGLAFIAFGLTTYHLRGIPHRLPEPARSYAAAVWDKPENARKCHRVSPERVKNFDLCSLGTSRPTKPDFIVWGDSHANMLLPVFRKLATENKLYGVQATYPACPPILYTPSEGYKPKEECVRFNQMMFKLIQKKNIRNVILSGYWSIYLEKYFNEPIPHTLKALSGKNVWIFTDVPNHQRRIPSALAKAALYSRDLAAVARSRADYTIEHRKILQQFQKLNTGNFKLIHAANRFCGEPLKYCKVLVNGKPLYSDAHHLSKYGALWITDLFRPAFQEIRENSRSLTISQNKKN